MHAVMLESLEEYLAGTLEPAVLKEAEAHLSACRACREEVRGMREVTQWLQPLRPTSSEPLGIPSGFYTRVMARVSRPAPSFASLFALDLAFGRRLVFASLLTLAVLGGYLVVHETGNPVGPSPEAILAQQNSNGFETAAAENNMLVTLAAYEH